MIRSIYTRVVLTFLVSVVGGSIIALLVLKYEKLITIMNNKVHKFTNTYLVSIALSGKKYQVSLNDCPTGMST